MLHLDSCITSTNVQARHRRATLNQRHGNREINFTHLRGNSQPQCLLVKHLRHKAQANPEFLEPHCHRWSHARCTHLRHRHRIFTTHKKARLLAGKSHQIRLGQYFQKTVAAPNVSLATAIEEIDIGGVALLRAAAKNHESVTVVCDPGDYAVVAAAFATGGTGAHLRRLLALKAFRHTAEYDTAIAAYLADQVGDAPVPDADGAAVVLPAELHLDLALVQRNRYGENPHQHGGLYAYAGEPQAFEVLHGKEMSYNNWLDLDGAWTAAQDFPAPTVAIIKHGNPCGLASADTLVQAYAKAYAADPVSAFGGILAVNRPLDLLTAHRAADLFLEVVAAPAFEPAALALLQQKKNVRILLHNGANTRPLSLRSIVGGVLVQELDRGEADMAPAAWRIVSQRQPTPEQLADLAFAWRVARHVKSNAIVYVREQATVGVGAGQMSRVDSVMMAGHKAGERSRGAVMASDAFFPFADGIEAAAKHGITAVVQPGGSVRDDEVIATVDRLGLVMCFTGARHFRH